MATENLGPPIVRVEGDGVTDTITFLFPVYEDDQCKLYKVDLAYLTDPLIDGPIAELIDPADYTVNIVASVEGGSVVLDDPMEDDFDYFFLRVTEEAQDLSIPLGEARLDVKKFERALDKLTLKDQERKLETRRALSFRLGSEKLDVTVADPVAGTMLLWNEDENEVIPSDMTYAELLTAIELAEDNAVAAAALAVSSADNAATSELNAQNSATAAAASQVAAGVSAAAAAVSENNAAVSEIAAELAQSLAEAAALTSQGLMQMFVSQAVGAGAVLNETNTEAGGVIANYSGRQSRPVTSTGGLIVLDDTPFGVNAANFVDGSVITVRGGVGATIAAAAKIVPADVAWGVKDPRGSIVFVEDVANSYLCDKTKQRFISLGRNI